MDKLIHCEVFRSIAALLHHLPIQPRHKISTAGFLGQQGRGCKAGSTEHVLVPFCSRPGGGNPPPSAVTGGGTRAHVVGGISMNRTGAAISPRTPQQPVQIINVIFHLRKCVKAPFYLPYKYCVINFCLFIRCWLCLSLAYGRAAQHQRSAVQVIHTSNPLLHFYRDYNIPKYISLQRKF